MNLIKKIEINYLRSLYSSVLNKVGDLNVVFGRNDSGKSNLLRALNLFFNGQIDPGQNLAFDIDLSDTRKQEAREAKGRQFIWIKITFEVPSNYRSVLGSEITIKRQWNRDGGMSETVFPVLDTSGKQARLTRFLNDIDFTYIPAVKDLNVYADLIERMYGAASETEVLRNATNQFVQAIAGQTESLSKQLTDLFGAPAALAPPSEMSRLFRNLDFAHGLDGHSMLRQKGDGVKARHLPELIRFINENEPRKKLFLWGFEEPENSLDLGAAEIEAKRFADFAGRSDTQVFVTSHSPAFYLANVDIGVGTVSRYFITKQTPDVTGAMQPANAATMIDDLSEAERKMEQAGLLQLPFIIRQLGDQRELLKAKEQEAEALRVELQQLRMPTLFVEGAHDVTLFERSLERLGVAGQIGVKSLGGTPKTTDALLAAVLEKGGFPSSARVLFLFDDDKAGRGAAKKLARSAPSSEPVAHSDNTFVCVLERTADFKQFMHRRSIATDQAFFTAEFLYPVEPAAALCLELVSAAKTSDVENWKKQINGDYWPSVGQKICGELISAEPGTADWFYARGVPDSLKKQFAESTLDRNFDITHLDSISKRVIGKLL
ncbi:AAA family ATPase [Marivibrio halodurans]|uniref:AAA family ATPase n=1 Tax=Marivibrio halodurans TaxID=2039722 RepID=A0A8J7SPT3_9PROT|nr:AAA family ATPase [Marivibrio halodurans]MBP5858828.1 AAA family ATPase [Marivibrio halodurans]